MDIQNLEAKILPILLSHGASRIGIFGSYARNEAGPDSDLDLLVDFSDRKSLLTLVRIKRELSEVLGMEIDLLTEAAVSPHLIDKIKSELRVIYQ